MYSCGVADVNNTGAPACTAEVPACDGPRCPLPPDYQYFTAVNVTRAFSRVEAPEGVGGWSDAMDFVPVRNAYWNCQDSEPSPTRVVAEGSDGGGVGVGGTSANVTVLQERATESKLFGGQSHCPNCRCFISSLLDLTKLSLDPAFPRYGLCYRSNCYTANYLQVAVRSQLTNRIDWYKCPPAGGKLHIPGYTGALHCPVAAGEWRSRGGGGGVGVGALSCARGGGCPRRAPLCMSMCMCGFAPVCICVAAAVAVAVAVEGWWVGLCPRPQAVRSAYTFGINPSAQPCSLFPHHRPCAAANLLPRVSRTQTFAASRKSAESSTRKPSCGWSGCFGVPPCLHRCWWG